MANFSDHRPSKASVASEPAGCYVYCVARASDTAGLGAIGIEGREVYAVVHHGLCALVHDCPAQPYQSHDPEAAAGLVLAHHRVVEAAWKRWGTVLPLTFNTIVAAGERSAEENLRAWLEQERSSLQGKLEALAGKAEYGVQVFWDADLISRKVAGASPQIRGLVKGMTGQPPGLAYMYRQKLERMLRQEMEARAAQACQELYERLSRCVDNIRVEKVRRGHESPQMLMNLSCLVSMEKSPGLETEVTRIGNTAGFFVRLTGPLPPYSFC